MEYQSKMQCSPNPCFDPGSPGVETTTTIDESMLQDDGPRDPNGQCLGQLYIFNGKASRCRPPGMKVGYLNNCCESDQVASEDTGASIQGAVQGIQMAYEIGQVAYYGNALVTGAAQISAISTTATGAVTSMTVVTATGTTTTLSGAAATGAYATMASGASGASALGAGLQAYAAALFNPATIAIAIVILVVMKVLMGSGCDQGDIQTGMQNAAKDCHYVGDYCERKWPLVGCVQKAKSFCCFNSKMARIIHEQGRPQLLAFQPNGAWGVPEQPNCRGFTPDEFQALDFSRIDLSEYFTDVQKDLATKIDGSQQTIMQNIQNKYQATPK
jgi:conjugal transfer mating pair stabilization protein TraN